MGTLAPRLTWTGSSFEPGLKVALGTDGRVAAVGADLPGPVVSLSDRALLPGFVNAHSHAFQRGLRGRGQTFPEGAGTFWTWRRAMYRLVEALSPETLRRHALQAFSEMRRAGFTAVGEFHYVHHGRGEDFALDAVVVEAAREAGIRLVLLQAAYQTADCDGGALGRAQARFATPDLGRFWDQLDHLADAGAAMGVVAHSLRAVPPDAVAALWRGACERKIPMHMHVEEQPQEIASARAAFGRTPMGVLLDVLEGLGAPQSPPFTAVHCTHSDPDELAEFLRRGGRVCVCPTTEADLGDGIPDGAVLAPHAARVCVGTDSNARISALEELRWLEHGQRWRGRTRGAWRDASGRVGATLLGVGAQGGAASLGLGEGAGRIEGGAPADLVAVDLSHPALADVPVEALPEALVLGCPDDVLAGTWVGGQFAGP